MRISAVSLILGLGIIGGLAQAQAPDNTEAADEVWLDSLITDSPQQGFELAVTLARRGVRTTQPDVEVLRDLRTAYASDPDSLIAISNVIAVHFQTIAAANDHWRSSEPPNRSSRSTND